MIVGNAVWCSCVQKTVKHARIQRLLQIAALWVINYSKFPSFENLMKNAMQNLI